VTGGWVVECPAFVAGPFGSRATAERRLAEIEELGACGYTDHVIREVA
jgi:hypothetical protein